MESNEPAHGIAYWTKITHAKNTYRVRVEAFAAEEGTKEADTSKWHWNWFADQAGIPIAGGFDRGVRPLSTFEEALKAAAADAEVVLRLSTSERH